MRLRQLHRVLLHGLPPRVAGDFQILWDHHLGEMHRDASVSRLQFLWQVVWSSVAHVGWRIFSGTPSGVLPGLFIAIAGAGSATFVLTDTNQLDATGHLFTAAGCLLFGTLLFRHPRVQPRGWTLLACWVLSVALIRSSWVGFNNILRPADWLLLCGFLCAVLGLQFLAASAVVRSASARMAWRRRGLGTASIGALLVGIANWDWIFVSTDEIYLSGLILSSLGTLLLGATLWRIKDIDQSESGFQGDIALAETGD